MNLDITNLKTALVFASASIISFFLGVFFTSYFLQKKMKREFKEFGKMNNIRNIEDLRRNLIRNFPSIQEDNEMLNFAKGISKKIDEEKKHSSDKKK
jgi:hypothetical protein